MQQRRLQEIEKVDFELKCKKDLEKAEMEKKQVKDKRKSYMQGLDQQISDNGRFKVTNAMTKAEMDFNM